MKSILLFIPAGFVFAQDKLPIIKSNSPVISIQDDSERSDTWSLTSEAKPDVYDAKLIDGKPHKVTFITDVDSISFTHREMSKTK